MSRSIYVAGGLTIAPPRFKDFLCAVVFAFETRVEVNRFFSLEILRNPSINGQNRYLFNEGQVLASGVLVAFCDYASTGMGQEIEKAHGAGKDIILLHKPNSHPALMLLDFAATFKYPIIRYTNAEPISDIVSRVLAELNK